MTHRVERRRLFRNRLEPLEQRHSSEHADPAMIASRIGIPLLHSAFVPRRDSNHPFGDGDFSHRGTTKRLRYHPRHRIQVALGRYYAQRESGGKSVHFMSMEIMYGAPYRQSKGTPDTHRPHP